MNYAIYEWLLVWLFSVNLFHLNIFTASKCAPYVCTGKEEQRFDALIFDRNPIQISWKTYLHFKNLNFIILRFKHLFYKITATKLRIKLPKFTIENSDDRRWFDFSRYSRPRTRWRTNFNQFKAEMKESMIVELFALLSKT